MIQTEELYRVISKNVTDLLGIPHSYFSPFGTTKEENLYKSYDGYHHLLKKVFNLLYTSSILYYDQEPILPDNDLPSVSKHITSHLSKHIIFANSEHSTFKNSLVKYYDFQDWYYFFHGIASLDWFRSYQHIQPTLPFQYANRKTFSCLNHLVTADRSYRLALVSDLIDRKLLPHGHVSMSLMNNGVTWEDEINRNKTKLSEDQKKRISKVLSNMSTPLTVDVEPRGTLSASISDSIFQSDWNIVPETIFYYEKLHLTEKIFKPIVAGRPFILAGAANNLHYLKSYGFKTFSDYINETYDSESDNEKRLGLIVDEVEKICNMSKKHQQEIMLDLQDIVHFNHSWFYYDFKHIIVDEMLKNLKTCLDNLDIPHDSLNWRTIYKLLTQ